MRYAECVFELTNKISDLYLVGYNFYPIDIRTIDFVRPLTPDKLEKLDSMITMEYPLIDEKAPFFLSVSRESAIPPGKIPENINQTLQFSKPTNIISSKELQARSKLVFSFTISDIYRPKNVMSGCFKTPTRNWSVLINTSKEGFVSLFLCERGPADKENKFNELFFTSVLFEIEIDDLGVTDALRSGNQPGFCAGFYCFPNNHYHMAGERNFCKVSAIRSPESVKINVFIKEIGIHSGLMHYLCENFDTLIGKNAKKFSDLCYFNLKYLLTHDHLPIADEHEAAGAL